MHRGRLILITGTNAFESSLQTFNPIAEVRCRMAGPAVGPSECELNPEISLGYAPSMPGLD